MIYSDKGKETGMRKAAGILMIIYGVITLSGSVVFLSLYGIRISAYEPPFHLFIIIWAVFITPGGVFCLKRKYWKICFTSSLFLLLFTIPLLF